MRLAGVIIAGGKSSRMGQEKALTPLNGKSLLSHVIERVAPQVQALIINANGDAARFHRFGLPVIPDRLTDIGTPLAGLDAALAWASENDCDAVLTVPSDAPFLPNDLGGRLRRDFAAVAASGGQTHYLTGIWPTDLVGLFQEFIAQKHRTREGWNPALLTKHTGVTRVQDWVAACEAHVVEWPSLPYDPFFNINTPADLAEAARIAAEFKP